jgi:hypothetical protein
LEKKEAFNALLKDIKHAKGKRLIFNLPLNGQRTKTNAKTIRRYQKIQNRNLKFWLCFIEEKRVDLLLKRNFLKKNVF